MNFILMGSVVKYVWIDEEMIIYFNIIFNKYFWLWNKGVIKDNVGVNFIKGVVEWVICNGSGGMI